MVRECVGVLPCKITRNKCELMLSKVSFLSEAWGDLTREIDDGVEEKVNYTLKHYGEFFEDLKPRLAALQTISEWFELRDSNKIIAAKNLPEKIHPLILSILLNSLYLVSKRMAKMNNKYIIVMPLYHPSNLSQLIIKEASSGWKRRK